MGALGPEVSVRDLVWADGRFWAASEQGVHVSSDGENWIRRNTGPVGFTPAEMGPAGAVFDGETLYVSGQSGQVLGLPLWAPDLEIVEQPTDQLVTEGETVEFRVATHGTTEPTHRWHLNGAPLEDGANISGSGTDTLRLLNVVVAQTGSYSVVVSGLTSREAALTVKTYDERQSFAAFRSSRFSEAEGADPAISGPAADPDADGLPNLLEYAFNLNPTRPDRAVPNVGRQEVQGEFYLTLTYRRLRNPADLTYEIQQSSDLRAWTAIPEGLELHVEALPGQPVDQVTVRHPVALNGSDRHYLRLQVHHNE